MSRWTDPAPAGALWGRTIAELRALYASGVTVTDVVNAAVARSEEVAELNAIVSISATAAAQAAALDALPLEDRGVLHGIPVLIKDNIDVAGERTAAGSPVLAEAPLEEADGVAVERLRAAGAVILGRTTMHEFAWGITSVHPTLPSPVNPYDASLVAGGSSGGSAVAVAVGIAPIALGTDTAGSVRIPAAFCGVTGLKGEWEWIPSEGSIPLAPSLDSFGVLARQVEDAELAACVMAGEQSGELPEVDSLRIGLATDSSWPQLIESHLAAMSWAADALSAAGSIVEPLSVEVGGRRLTPYASFARVQSPQAYAVHTELLGTWPDRKSEYGSEVSPRLENAERMVDSGDCGTTPEIERDLGALLQLVDSVDVVLMPVSAAGPSSVASPDHVGEELLRDTVLPFTAAVNLIGAAAFALPTPVLDPHGIPVSVQLVAGKGDLAGLVAAARAIESERLRTA